MTYHSPQEAEDAFYDALEAGDLEQMLSVWAETDDLCCLLPMQPMIRSRREVTDLFSRILSQGSGVSLTVRHLAWIRTDDIAIHQIEETIQNPPPGAPPPPPFYGTNIYRKDATGWRLVVHQNAPTPPPPPAA
jgi:ketosteroid isomerase-like protein